ncbi:2-polyprenyl-3-methyl-5-hydroxy-6-metoxy-1,4-benzoquinol methylase [Pseudaminobacter salicylatoxidans]|uniref:2-polyprenyl-3-methyl-5-hydroxy-6-metoxy-1, 4-benzoquinol methylase n=1 Tax=Pseudaminobacter salicylatoxidans TaxID=93369 RepID=A0A316C5R9_PSESE|nr:class I SAM-dependent methyltransferase [Pseudaminobacter salicylatoxidans]PWJ85019.1 2-polyprenyl-3-methyl-5-hydroxy-6-metoxy-1,4-benzoquinol methylase [Pseudaminobacter salicylatoxidans]
MGDSFSNMLSRRNQRADVYSQADFWNEKARNYDGSAVSMWKNQALNACYEREQFAFIDKAIGDPKGLHILDMGCGTGRLSRHLTSQGAAVEAFDFAEETIRIAKAQDPSSSIRYRVQSSFDISEVSTFDVVAAIGNLTVACKTPADVETIVRLVHRALKPGGRFIVVEPFHDSFLSRVLRLTTAGYADILTRNGFRVDARKELHFWPARLPLCLAAWPRPLTVTGYYAGQALLAAGGQWLGLGDYKGVAATRAG